jgi:hypothetical protein
MLHLLLEHSHLGAHLLSSSNRWLVSSVFVLFFGRRHPFSPARLPKCSSHGRLLLQYIFSIVNLLNASRSKDIHIRIKHYRLALPIQICPS